jgi:hypothetical protein
MDRYNNSNSSSNGNGNNERRNVFFAARFPRLVRLAPLV